MYQYLGMPKPAISSSKRLADNVSLLQDKFPHLDTQPKLAAKAGISQSHVSRVKNCEQNVSLFVLDALARDFDLEPWQLLADSDSLKQLVLAKLLQGPHAKDERVAEYISPAPKIPRKPRAKSPRRK